MLHITTADIADARAILMLQKQAYESEARLYPGVDLPPMTQTLGEMQHDLKSLTVLKAMEGEQIVGSVRAGVSQGICNIGRLIIAPHMQRKGLGTRLMAAIEDCFPRVSAYELFTGEKSAGNLEFYLKLGYTRTSSRAILPGLTLVFLRKANHQ